MNNNNKIKNIKVYDKLLGQINSIFNHFSSQMNNFNFRNSTNIRINFEINSHVT